MPLQKSCSHRRALALQWHKKLRADRNLALRRYLGDGHAPITRDSAFMPVTDDAGADSEEPAQLRTAAQVVDEFARFNVHSIEDYTHREFTSSAIRESSGGAEIHTLRPLENLVPGREVMNDVARRLRIANIATGLTARALCAEIGVQESTFNNWTTGDRPPDVWAMTRLAERFGIDLDYIFRGTTDGMTAIVVKQLREAEVRLQDKEAVRA